MKPSEWDEFLKQLPNAHILQSREWGEFKAGFGWKPVYLLVSQSGKYPNIGVPGSLKRLPFGFSMGYIAKGPPGELCMEVGPQACKPLWLEVDQISRREHAVFLKWEPDMWELAQGSNTVQIPLGFRFSPQSIQPKQTILVDLRQTEPEILDRMKQKTRYNIRLAQKKGVTVAPCEDSTRSTA